jgi:transcriptional regulator with XRE-family HTH domain
MEVVAERVNGQKLRELRLAKLMTQRELALRAGVAPETLNRIERSSEPRSTSVLTTRKIAAALGVDPRELLED